MGLLFGCLEHLGLVQFDAWIFSFCDWVVTSLRLEGMEALSWFESRWLM